MCCILSFTKNCVKDFYYRTIDNVCLRRECSKYKRIGAPIIPLVILHTIPIVSKVLAFIESRIWGKIVIFERNESSANRIYTIESNPSLTLKYCFGNIYKQGLVSIHQKKVSAAAPDGQ